MDEKLSGMDLSSIEDDEEMINQADACMVDDLEETFSAENVQAIVDGVSGQEDPYRRRR
ncbi:MAG: hypothetical protein Q4P33_00700 [Flaviflexus sp.]|nr:hypothetical protein [Flaviflexus sp.]